MLVVVVLLALLVGGVTAGKAWHAASRARTAADLAALAGSGAAAPTRFVPVPPCVEAARVAAENGALMTGCSVRDFDVTVVVSVDSNTPFGRTSARSTAGPRPQTGPRRPGSRPPQQKPVRKRSGELAPVSAPDGDRW